jgi:phosphoenolpyruvate carboxykinase (ATP)
MIRAALIGGFDRIQFHSDRFFGLMIPDNCPDVPSEVLNPQSTWKDGMAYEREANLLIQRFKQNFETFRSSVSFEVVAAGPG